MKYFSYSFNHFILIGRVAGPVEVWSKEDEIGSLIIRTSWAYRSRLGRGGRTKEKTPVLIPKGFLKAVQHIKAHDFVQVTGVAQMKIRRGYAGYSEKELDAAIEEIKEVGAYTSHVDLIAEILSDLKKPREYLVADYVLKILDADLSHCLLYTSPSPRDRQKSRMPSSA